MLRRRLAATVLVVALGTALAACDSEGGGADSQQAPTGQEDPTLNNDTDGGNPASGGTDNGSGTGSGRGTP